MLKAVTKYLNEYIAPTYFAETIELTFTISDIQNVLVKSVTNYTRNNSSSSHQLVLDGKVELLEVYLNDKKLTTNDYIIRLDQIELSDLPEKFILTILTKINPDLNKTGLGLYKAEHNLLTQCEAEGFRKITFFQDRPDVMTSFITHIIADKSNFPILLSNGNKINEQNLPDNKVKVSWHDPFKKPCYLFALVAGSYESIADTFTTKSGRLVNLIIYTEKENLNRLSHAIGSLKRAMAWDESRFNLEYDLDSYMIVATNNFNMGAMENKGLNIFNAKYVLADQYTATDTEFVNVEAVIGHEYFHNWTGNRVTCRDWFQLSLKEGLTVFRDQEFTADMHDRGVKRIDDVKDLRHSQFLEDNGPLAHSVRPNSYIEINNFYTTTIYEKGAEVVRLYQTILGIDGFNRGLELYFKRYDGMAVTCNDFCKAMSDANDVNLDQFMLWYSQAGTPQISVNDSYDKQKNEYSIIFKQTIPDTPGQLNKQPMLIPVRIGLLNNQGVELTNLNVTSGNYLKHDNELILLLTNETNTFNFKLPESTVFKPIPSLFRQFSAPVEVEYNYTDDERLLLIAHDSDQFNSWENLQQLFKQKIHAIYLNLLNKETLPTLDIEFGKVLLTILNNPKLNPQYKALTLTLPSFSEMLTTIKNTNPVLLIKSINYLAYLIGENLFDSWIEIYNANLTFHYEFKENAKRRLKNTALNYIMATLKTKIDNQHSLQLIETLLLGQYNNADNMTDILAVLNVVNNIDIQLRTDLLNKFYTKWQTNELVINKWFSIQAISHLVTIEQLNKLMLDKTFIATNPNKIYALLYAFTSNGLKFHSEDGYEFIANNIIAIDKFNPQVASGLATTFSNALYLHSNYRDMARNTLKRIINNSGLSNDVQEITNKILLGFN